MIVDAANRLSRAQIVLALVAAEPGTCPRDRAARVRDRQRRRLGLAAIAGDAQRCESYEDILRQIGSLMSMRAIAPVMDRDLRREDAA